MKTKHDHHIKNLLYGEVATHLKSKNLNFEPLVAFGINIIINNLSVINTSFVK